MNKRLAIYWISQLTGWALFVLGNLLVASFGDQLSSLTYIASVCMFLSGIGLTHLFRYFIHRRGWDNRNIPSLLPRVVLASIILSVVFSLINTIVTNLYFDRFLFYKFHALDFMNLVLNLSVLFLVWSILYFAVITFRNWKNEEFKNLELRAAKTEIELNSFRAQMNPHFMFNSLNSVRALIDENPEKAKHAVTLLSGILRNNLLLGRKQMVPLKEELDLVEKYLSLERVRFEERLQVEYNIHPSTMNCVLPPFMLQTIVENAIKHGISRRMRGGFIRLDAKLENSKLHIAVTNSGKLISANTTSGIGIANTKKRMDLLFGEEADFRIESIDDTVVVTLIIPQTQNNAAKNINS